MKENKETLKDFLYAAWRFEMWIKGYGTYIEIEDAVLNGELVPGKEYPDQRADGAGKERSG